MSWYIYIRMSSSKSSQSGISEEIQLQVAMDYLRSVSVITHLGKGKFPSDSPDGVFIDRAESGWSKDLNQRKAGHELLRVLKPGDHVVFYNVERAFRNTFNCLKWVGLWAKNGITPHFACEQVNFMTAGGRFIGTIAAAAAQYYSDLISERVTEAKAIKRKQLGVAAKPKSVKEVWAPSNIVLPSATVAPEKINGCVRIYNRVSSEDQKLSGLSMDVQRNGNLKNGMRIMRTDAGGGIKVYEDESVSAFSKAFQSRPGASRLYADLKAGDHVVIYRTDRAFRSIKDAVTVEQDLRARGVTLHLTRDGIRTDNDYGRMFFHVLAIFAELESSIKRRRKLELNEYLRKEGRPTNGLWRHHKVVKVGRVKKLAHDFEAILDMFIVWILRQGGFSAGDANNYMHAILGQRLKKVPVQKRSKKARNKACLPMTNESTAKWMTKNIGITLAELPEEMAKDMVSKAIQLIQTPVEPQYLSHCIFGHSFPVVDIADRLASREIDDRLARLLPSHALCASTLA